MTEQYTASTFETRPTHLRDFAYLPGLPKKLAQLAKLAMPEPWSFAKPEIKRENTDGKACELTGDVYSPGGDSPVFEYDGRYFRSKGENIYPITNFLVRPIEMITSDEEAQLTADLVTTRNENIRLTFMTTDFANTQKFKNALNRRTIALGYTGSDGDLELLKSFLSELDWPTKMGVKAIGIYQRHNSAVFVSCDGAVDSCGLPVGDIVQLEKYASVDSDILKARPLNADELRTLGGDLLSYNEPAKAIPMGLDPTSEYCLMDGDTVLAIWLNHVYDRYTKYRKDYAVLGETLTYAQFKKQLQHSDYYIDSNVQKRIGSENRKVWTLNYELLQQRCDVGGFRGTEISPL